MGPVASACSLGPAPDSNSRPINFAIWAMAVRGIVLGSLPSVGARLGLLDDEAHTLLTDRFSWPCKLPPTASRKVRRPRIGDHGRRTCSRNGSGSVGEPKGRIHLPPAGSLPRTSKFRGGRGGSTGD